MPKLAEDKQAERLALVEEAALGLFRERGFHGVGLREIAAAAGVSLGNIYNYFEGKEALFVSVLGRLYKDFADRNEPLARYLAESRFPDDLEAFGRAVGRMVDEHRDYLTLVYVDIAEFGGRHVRSHYEGLAERFGRLLAPRLETLSARGRFPQGVDPAVAVAAVYMQFFNYFIVEKLIGAKGHLGLSDPEAVGALARIFQSGLGEAP